MSTVAEPVTAARVSAAPRLAFRDPAKAIEFYQRALGAKEKFRFQIGDSVPHAELMIGDSPIDITGEWPEGGRFSAETLGHSQISISVEVPDVDERSQPGEPPEHYVVRIARAKAAAVRARGAALPVLAADTSVVIDGHSQG